MTFREIQSRFSCFSSPRFLCLLRDLDRGMLNDVECFQKADLSQNCYG